MNQILPVTSDPNQTFQSTLAIDGVNKTYKFTVNFNETAGYWVMSIIDPETDLPILSSIPLLVGANILAQYRYLGIGSAVLLNVGNDPDEVPTSENLGTTFVLVWGDTPNV